MEPVRPPAVAGAFYPGDGAGLRRTVADLLAAAESRALGVSPQLFVVPHAGYVYSGPVAATVYATMVPERDRRVVLLGPSHFVPFPGLALPAAGAMATPLGRVDLDADLVDRALAHPAVVRNANAHAREHSLEVQLPFLQVLSRRLTVLPLLTGDDDADAAGEVLDDLVDPEVIVVVSSDLSHYLDATTAADKDRSTAQAIVGLQEADIAWDDACGATAVRAAVIVARRRGWGGELIDLRTSADTAGDARRVVGYGAFAFGPAA